MTRVAAVDEEDEGLLADRGQVQFHPCLLRHVQLLLGGGGGKDYVRIALYQPLIGFDGASTGYLPVAVGGRSIKGVFSFRIDRLDKGGVHWVQGRSSVQTQCLPVIQFQRGRTVQGGQLVILAERFILPQQEVSVIHRGQALPIGAYSDGHHTAHANQKRTHTQPPLHFRREITTGGENPCRHHGNPGHGNHPGDIEGKHAHAPKEEQDQQGSAEKQ